MSRAEDGFLSRWARRKAEARAAHAGPSPEEPPAADPPAPAPDPEPAMTAAEIAELPPIETADADALRAYLRKGAPAALKALAMRRMWTLNPAIRGHVDPALDYAFDWNTPGAAPWSPLGAGDDVRAMVERVMGGPPRRAEDAPPAEAEGATGDAAVEPPPAVEAPPAADSDAPQHPGEPTAADPAPGPRRRHGGAVPT